MQEGKGTFRRALELSLLLHLLLVFLLLPQVERAWPDTPNALFSVQPETPPVDQAPLEFEFVDLAEEREEAPVSDRVPLSDLDRRAHGGEGEAAARPSSIGNTPQLVQADGSERFGRGEAPRLPQPEHVQVPTPEAEPSEQEMQPTPRPELRVKPKETGEEAAERQSPLLPPPAAWAQPPAFGGLPENPDLEGGQVDTSGLSFDTQWYDWGPYAKAMLAKIRRHWRIPEIARLGVTGVVKIRFFIERDGTVSGLTIVDESGRPPMDFAARDAIATSSPFEALPSDLTGVTREGVTITFYYNTRPPERGRR